MNSASILHLIPRLTGGGMERRMGLIATGMAARGWQVHVAYLDHGENAADVEFEGVTRHAIQAAHNYDPAMFFRLLFLVRRERPHIIQTWSPQMDILGAILAPLARARWVLMEPTSGQGYASRTWKLRMRCHLAKRAVVVSNSLAGDRYWRDKPTRGRRVIRNGQQVQHILKASAIDQARLPVDEGTAILLFVGRLNATATGAKNLQTCLDVVARLSAHIPPVKLLVCGDGSERGSWEKKVAHAGLEDRVAFLGYLAREDVWGVMKTADALLSFSFFEGCPNVVQEAMLCQCPLVISDIPEHREFLTEAEALLVDPHSPNDCSLAVSRLLSDRRATAERAAHAFTVASQFTVDRMLDQYEDLYLDLTRPARRSAPGSTATGCRRAAEMATQIPFTT